MYSILKEFKVINNHINDNKFDNPISITTTFETKCHYVHYCYPGFLDGHKVKFSFIDTNWILFLKSSFFFIHIVLLIRVIICQLSTCFLNTTG